MFGSVPKSGMITGNPYASFSGNDLKKLRELAWVGDAVLAIYARKWILESEYKSEAIRARVFSRMTSNQFLSSIGQPTQIEAEIAHIFEDKGIDEAFVYIEENILPVFKKQMSKLKKQSPGKSLEQIL